MSFESSSVASISRSSERGIRKQPYGYASHDVHVMARVESRVIGHVGWARGEIVVGTEAVAIAGVGGVLISADARGVRLDGELMGVGRAVDARS